jgi:hypothetical protein
VFERESYVVQPFQQAIPLKTSNLKRSGKSAFIRDNPFLQIDR